MAMVSDLVASFKQLVSQSAWMDEDTKVIKF